MSDYKYAADLLYQELRRVYPEELAKTEALEGTGLSVEEGRKGLEQLEAEGRVDTSGGQLKAVVAGDEEPAEPVEPTPGPDEAAPVSDVPPPESTGPVPHAGETYRGHYEISVAFGQNPGTNTEAVVKTAKAMEEEIADRISKMYPGAIVSVELKAIDQDQPKRIYDSQEEPE